MSNEGFAALAARSAKVRNEHRLLLEGLRSFQQKLVDLVAGLGCGGNSKTVTFEEFTDSEGDVIGHIEGYLFFDGQELFIGSKEEPRSSWEESYWTVCTLEKAGPAWQRRLSDPKVLDSLVTDILRNLNREFEKTACVVQTLSQFVTIEKAEIDADLDELFSGNPMFLDGWLKARKLVLIDPEQSISLSCSHIETVLKGCLKTLGETGYETFPIEKLIKKVLSVFRTSSVIDSATSEMLQGVGTICHGIGTIRNCTSHGKDHDYTPPTPALAQTVNHLAGIVSVFAMKQTDLLLKAK